MRKNGDLNFETAGRVLNENCTYLEENYAFKYTGPDRSNYLLKLKVRSKRGNFSSIPPSIFNY